MSEHNKKNTAELTKGGVKKRLQKSQIKSTTVKLTKG